MPGLLVSGQEAVCVSPGGGVPSTRMRGLARDGHRELQPHKRQPLEGGFSVKSVASHAPRDHAGAEGGGVAWARPSSTPSCDSLHTLTERLAWPIGAVT